MAHGTPLAAGDADDQCGAAGAFLLEVGISSSYYIAKFWGLAEVPRATAVEDGKLVERHQSEAIAIDERAEERPFSDAEPASAPHSLPVDIGAVITQALKAAGLLKTN